MEQLIKNFLKTKKAENAARVKRIAAEEAIVAAMGFLKQEGTTSLKTDGYKVSVTTKVNRSLDYDQYQMLSIPKKLDFVELKPVLNTAQLRLAMQEIPDMVAKCVTSTPAKTSVKVEVMK